MYDLKVLGSPRLTHNEQLITINRRKSLGLLIYLAVTGQISNRETLATLLWSDMETSRALSNLRTAIWSLNKTLGDDWAITEGDMLGINRAAFSLIDVYRFRDLVCHDERIEALKESIALYDNDFLAGFSMPDSREFEDWLFIERENLKQQFGQALDMLVIRLIEQQDFAEAIPYAQRRILVDPLHEPAYQQLMRLYAWTDQLAAAHHQYRYLQNTLHDELGIPPSRESEQLYQMIAGRKLAPTPIRETGTYPVINLTPSALPSQALPFIGRENELHSIEAQLADVNCRLLTLIGAGGIGKTRLAIRAAEMADYFADGVVFVSLAPLNSSDNIAPAILSALKLQKPENQDSHDYLYQVLAEKNMLLVLDNYEHLLPDTQLIEHLLAHTPDIKVLITSRERLNLREEWVIDVTGLAYPASSEIEGWQRFSAIELFTISARRNNHAFTLTDETAEAIIAICKFVGGMPLGIELAAAWTDVLQASDILRELEHNLDFLTTDAVNIPERQRSVRVVLDYAWSRLKESERHMMSRLSLFPDAFTLDAAREVTDVSISDMRRLLNQMLLRRLPDGCYHMHELVRQFAWQQFDSEQQADAKRRYYHHYHKWLVWQLPRLKSHKLMEALHEMLPVMESILQAYRFAVECEDWACLIPMTEALWMIHAVYHNLQQMEGVIRDTIQLLRDRSDIERLLHGWLLVTWADLRRLVGHQSEVDQLVNEALVLLNQHQDHPYSALPLAILSCLYIHPGVRLERYEPLLLRAIDLFKQTDDVWGLAYAYFVYGFSLHNAAQYREVEHYALLALGLFRQLGHPWGVANTFDLLVSHTTTLGDYAQGRLYCLEQVPYIEMIGDRLWAEQVKREIDAYSQVTYDVEQIIQSNVESRAVYLKLGNKMSYAWTTYHMAWAYFMKEDYEAAQRYYQEALQLFYELGTTEGIAWSHIFRGSIYMEQGLYDEAEKQINLGLMAIQNISFPWAASGAAYIQGDMALRRGQLNEAAQYYYDAIQSAYDVQSAELVTRHLIGAAEWLRTSGDDVGASRIAKLVLAQPVHDLRTHRRGQAIYGQDDLCLDADETVEDVVNFALAALKR